MLIVSGDTDGAVPYLGTIKWISELGWNVKEDPRAWFCEGDYQGLFRTYEGGLDFVTVHGTGHMSP